MGLFHQTRDCLCYSITREMIGQQSGIASPLVISWKTINFRHYRHASGIIYILAMFIMQRLG